MKQQICSRCGERPAVLFIQKMEDGEVKPEGLCIKCARELNIGNSIITLGIVVDNTEHLNNFLARLKKVDNIISVERASM